MNKPLYMIYLLAYLGVADPASIPDAGEDEMESEPKGLDAILVVTLAVQHGKTLTPPLSYDELNTALLRMLP